MLLPILRRAFIQSASQPSLFPFRAHLSTTFHPSSLLETTTDPLLPPLSTPNRPLHLKPSPFPATPPPPSTLSQLQSQPPYYIIPHIHARPYLLTSGDILRLPFHIPHVVPGTILRLNRAALIGSRDYTLRGAPWIDERCFVCRCRVMGVEGEPMRVVEKTKRRQRHVRRVKHKMRFTIIRCLEIAVRLPKEGEEGD